jgi:hypothetical protein
MIWFKNAYDRAETAEFILQAGLERGVAEEYYPGFRRASLAVPVGGLALMNHYPRRMVYDREEGRTVPVATPFFAVHFKFVTVAGDNTEAYIQFDNNFAYLQRSGERDGSGYLRPDQTRIWDEAMATLDESLLTHAHKLGWSMLAPVVEAAPLYQESELRLAA